MLSSSDLIRQPYTPDLTEAGLLSTCHWLAGSSQRLGDNPFSMLRRKIGQVAVELAFRRLLSDRHVSSLTMNLEPFNEPHHHDLSLGGHRLHLDTTLITRRSQIRNLRRQPSELLQASALVPLDQFVREGQTNNDIYVFAFLMALAATSQAEQLKVESSNQPHYYLSILPGTWSRPEAWVPMGPLAMKSDAAKPVAVELGGQNAERDFLSTRIQLEPSIRTLVPEDFYSLAYIHNLNRPTSRLGLHSSRFSQATIVQTTDWGNIWLYGLEICFAGWLTHEEYRRRSILLPAGQHTYQYSHTRIKNLCVPLPELRPLDELFDLLQTGKNQGTA